MEVILKRNQPNNAQTLKNEPVFGNKIGTIAGIFGCWHSELSRPFSKGKTAYRVCLTCGARRKFDLESMKTFGPFHFPPSIPNIKSDSR